jgi:hypothetical protein
VVAARHTEVFPLHQIVIVLPVQELCRPDIVNAPSNKDWKIRSQRALQCANATALWRLTVTCARLAACHPVKIGILEIERIPPPSDIEPERSAGNDWSTVELCEVEAAIVRNGNRLRLAPGRVCDRPRDWQPGDGCVDERRESLIPLCDDGAVKDSDRVVQTARLDVSRVREADVLICDKVRGRG